MQRPAAYPAPACTCATMPPFTCAVQGVPYARCSVPPHPKADSRRLHVCLCSCHKALGTFPVNMELCSVAQGTSSCLPPAPACRHHHRYQAYGQGATSAASHGRRTPCRQAPLTPLSSGPSPGMQERLYEVRALCRHRKLTSNAVGKLGAGASVTCRWRAGSARGQAAQGCPTDAILHQGFGFSKPCPHLVALAQETQLVAKAGEEGVHRLGAREPATPNPGQWGWGFTGTDCGQCGDMCGTTLTARQAAETWGGASCRLMVAREACESAASVQPPRGVAMTACLPA